MLESKLNLDFKLVEQARAHAARVADDTQRFIDGCTTVAVERTICRLLGIDGVDAVTPVYQQSAYIVSGNWTT